VETVAIAQGSGAAAKTEGAKFHAPAAQPSGKVLSWLSDSLIFLPALRGTIVSALPRAALA